MIGSLGFSSRNKNNNNASPEKTQSKFDEFQSINIIYIPLFATPRLSTVYIIMIITNLLYDQRYSKDIMIQYGLL